MFADYNSGVYTETGYVFGPEWIGTFIQYTRRQAGYYRDMDRKYRRALEIKAHQEGIRQVETFVNPRTGRAELQDHQRHWHAKGGRMY
jgi:hypothetical protein